MKLRILAVAAFAVGVFAVSCGTDSKPLPTADGTGTPSSVATTAPGGGGGTDVAAGETKFKATCATCHGADAKGLPGLGKDLTTSKFAKGLSDSDLVAFVKAGRPATDPANTTGVDMPPKGGNPALTDQDIASIVAYIRTTES